jgi:stage II sporulation protein AA (anti-sigma F factor antagonist)
VLNGVSVLAVAGRVGGDSASRLATAIDGAANGRRTFVIDLAQVDYVSSAGLEVMRAAAARCAARQGALILSSLSEPVRIAFDLAGLGSQIAVEPTREQAVARALAIRT